MGPFMEGGYEMLKDNKQLMVKLNLFNPYAVVANLSCPYHKWSISTYDLSR